MDDLGAEPVQPEPQTQVSADPVLAAYWAEADRSAAAAPPPVGQLEVGDVLRRTLDLFVRRPLIFLALAVPTAIVGAVTSELSVSTGTTGTNGTGLLSALVTGVVGLVLGVATVIAADDLRGGRPVSLSAVVSRSLKVAVSAVLSGIAQYVVLIGLLAVSLILLIFGGGAAVLGLGLALFAIGYVALRWSLSSAAIALEDTGPIEALRRSRALTKGNLWRIVAISLALALIAGPLLVGAGLLAYVIGGWAGEGVSAVAGIATTPLFGIASATIFGDLTGRTEAPAVPAPNPRLRTGYAVALVALGVLALAVAVPKYGAATDQHALDGVPAADRGVIYAGTMKTVDPCHPVGTKPTFTSTDSIYLGGYFKRSVPAGQKATIDVYANGTLANTVQVGDPSRPTSCYRELDPIVGGSPGTYRLVVTYAGEIIAEGMFTIQ